MKSLAPYQVFFPIGFLSSLLAVGVWLTQDLQLFGTPALLIHSRLIMGGFLWSFVVGFLMTAIPKMTGTRAAGKGEICFGLLMIIGQIATSWSGESRWFYGFSMLTTSLIAVFAVRRIIKKQKAIPVFFSHVGLAFLTAFFGALFYFLQEPLLGLHLYHIGPVLLLVLGIGTRFFSFLSGLPSDFESAPTKPKIIFHALGVGVVLSLIWAGRGSVWGYLALSLLSCFYMVFVWKFFRRSQRNSALKWGMRGVALMIPLSFFLCWLSPANFIGWLHLLFIGCFGLITYAVASRVILAHGSYSTDYEIQSPALWIFVAFLSFSLGFRILYVFLEASSKMISLKLAASLWIFAISCWGFSFVKKIFMAGPMAKASC